MNDEHEDLQALQTHPGWLRVLTHAKLHWGSGAYARRLEGAKDLTELAALKLAHGWLNELLTYPSERVKALEHVAAGEHPVTMQRGGS